LAIPFSFGGKGEAGLDVLRRQVREVIENFGHGHPRGQVGEDIVNGDSHAADAGTATTLARLNGDSRSPWFVHQKPPLPKTWLGRESKDRESIACFPAAVNRI